MEKVLSIRQNGDQPIACEFMMNTQTARRSPRRMVRPRRIKPTDGMTRLLEEIKLMCEVTDAINEANRVLGPPVLQMNDER